MEDEGVVESQSLPFVAQVIIAEASRLLELLLSAEAVINLQMKQVVRVC